MKKLLNCGSYVLHVVEAQRGAAARVLQGLRGEGFVVAVDEAGGAERYGSPERLRFSSRETHILSRRLAYICLKIINDKLINSTYIHIHHIPHTSDEIRSKIIVSKIIRNEK